ncbi:ATP-binding protein [Fibrobacterota bacterium]
MENPFVFGRAVTDNAFINRQKELREISDALRDGQSVILFSPRRFGKTSLIKKAMNRLKKKKILCFYVDLYRITSLEQFFRDYSNTIAGELKSPAEKVYQTIKEILPSLKPKLVFKDIGVPSVEFDVGIESLKKKSSLKELFESVEIFCKKKSRKAVIVFDEFQEIKNMPEYEGLEREMRSAFQHHQHVSYAFLGSKYHLMQEIFNDKNRPFYNFGMHVELGIIEAEHWEKHITQCFRKEKFIFSEKVCSGIMNYAKGHPYYTQVLCRELWSLTSESKRVGAKHVETALQNSLTRLNHGFVEVWDALNMRARNLLFALTSKPESKIFSAAFVNEFNLGATSTVQETVKSLLKKGIMQKKNNTHSIADPFFGLWIKLKE